jgi:hypothetical protein
MGLPVSLRLPIKQFRALDAPGSRDVRVPGFIHRPSFSLNQTLTSLFIIRPWRRLWRTAERERMVTDQVEARGIRDPNVLPAMRSTRRSVRVSVR